MDWQVLEEVEPWGQSRDDYRFACLAAIIVNALGLTRSDKQPWLATQLVKEFRDSWKIKRVEIPSPPTPAVVIDPAIKAELRSTNPRNMERWIDLWARASNQRMLEQKKKKRQRNR